MLNNKDIGFDKNTNELIINGRKYDLASPEALNQLVDDVAELESKSIKIASVSAVMSCVTADEKALGGYRSISDTSKLLRTFTGYPTGKEVLGQVLYCFGENAAILGTVNVSSGVVYINTAYPGEFNVRGIVFYTD